MMKTMEANEKKMAIILAMIGVIIGIVGLWAFYINNVLILVHPTNA